MEDKIYCILCEGPSFEKICNTCWREAYVEEKASCFICKEMKHGFFEFSSGRKFCKDCVFRARILYSANNLGVIVYHLDEDEN